MMSTSDNRFYREKPCGGEQVLIDYTNHAGVRAIRQIAPVELRFGASEWHPDPQYLLDAYDLVKDDMRTFAVAGIHRWGMPGMKMTADVSIAKQLQLSMERNARMTNRLQRLGRALSGLESELPASAPELDTALNRIVLGNSAIEAILKDEEPTWLG